MGVIKNVFLRKRRLLNRLPLCASIPAKTQISMIFYYLCNMRPQLKNRMKISKEEIDKSILHSMIASFKIEKINISEKEAHEIYKIVRKRLKKEA